MTKRDILVREIHTLEDKGELRDFLWYVIGSQGVDKSYDYWIELIHSYKGV